MKREHPIGLLDQDVVDAHGAKVGTKSDWTRNPEASSWAAASVGVMGLWSMLLRLVSGFGDLLQGAFTRHS